MNKFYNRAAVLVILALTAGLVACGSNDAINGLELAVDAASIALPLVAQSTNMPADVQARIQSGLDTTLADLAQAADILAGPGTDASKGAQVAALFTNVPALVVPPQYQAIAAAVDRVAKMLAKFLATLPTPAPAGASKARAPMPTSGKSTPVTAAQAGRLAAAKAKAEDARKAARK